MIILHIPDSTGTGTVKTLASMFAAAGVALPPGNQAKWIRIVEVTKGAAVSRLGGPGVSGTNGTTFDITTNSLSLPASAGYDKDALYDLDDICLFHASGDVVSIAVGVWKF